ncbi:hypothetical protein EVJ58_g7713 [Rhodofomes roseus]|uniref:Uncharacterized protein n=1 Tax=Rhodofomes roseus TaxID=34475 RepID=A0A4Y9Y3H0_9APHY|nr:hypothetical protein EVJ58_g7713 [Rhodofomes roseus]
MLTYVYEIYLTIVCGVEKRVQGALGHDPPNWRVLNTCPPLTRMENWKAASAEANKKMWGIFDETGIFASACQHGFILWLFDMVWSGKLAK